MSRPTAAARFSADWLHLREPFDAAARDAAQSRLALQARLARWRLQACASVDAPLRVLDLGCGTGANLRWLAPRLGGLQQWMVVDHDAALLRRWPQEWASRSGGRSGSDRPAGAVRLDDRLRFTGAGFEAEIVRRRLDLAAALERLPWHAAQLVTASALIDLPGADWLGRLAAATADFGAALLMALSVDGRHRWIPHDPDDGAAADAFRAHQRRDKGFGGPALGPDGAPVLAQALRDRGYRVFTARSDWLLDGGQAPALALQRALVDGIAAAAVEQSPGSAALMHGWRQRRQALAVRTVLRVGHVELLALPPSGRVPRRRGPRPDPAVGDPAMGDRARSAGRG